MNVLARSSRRNCFEVCHLAKVILSVEGENVQNTEVI